MGPHSPAAQSEENRWSWGQSVNAGDSRVCSRRSAWLRSVTAGSTWWGGEGWVQLRKKAPEGRRPGRERVNSSASLPRLGQLTCEARDPAGSTDIRRSRRCSCGPPVAPNPRCPGPNPKPQASGPFQQLCQAFGWVRA